jgi:hypothetical protein
MGTATMSMVCVRSSRTKHESDTRRNWRIWAERWGWGNILGWYKEWAFWGIPRRVREFPSQDGASILNR